MRLAIVALVAMGAALVAPAAALAQDGRYKLGLLPVGQPGPYFDLTMKPGETGTFAVHIANDGETAVAAATYAADVYTIINGGFGGRLRDEPQTGATGWIDYPADVLELAPGDATHRSFTIAVPHSAPPGEYITSLILENDQPTLDEAALGLNQIVRQAVAVVVTVPGSRLPGLAIGRAAHIVAAGRSIVQIAVENTGNIRLKPIVGFSLVDPAGAQVSHATVQMDTFYAHTKAFVEVPLAALLAPGSYRVGLTLADARQGAEATAGEIMLIVEAPAEAADDGGVVPGLIEEIKGGGPLLAVLALVLVASTLFALGASWLVHRRRSGREA
jgi:hypothetical protein